MLNAATPMRAMKPRRSRYVESAVSIAALVVVIVAMPPRYDLTSARRSLRRYARPYTERRSLVISATDAPRMAALRTRGCTLARKLPDPDTMGRPMHDRFHLVSYPLTHCYGND